MEQPLFHVLLDGRKVGPYDRRTIVGMRIKDTLTSEHAVVDTAGNQLTVADLIGQRPAGSEFSPNRTGGFSIVQATYAASLVAVQGRGLDIPRFAGEIEVRVQGDVLRIAGRFRKRLGWKEDRVKLPLADVVHARVKGSRVELWLRTAQAGPLQRVALELFTPDTAGALVDWLPAATPWPEPANSLPAAPVRAPHRMLWAPLAGVTMAVGIIFAVLLYRRLY